MHLLYLDDSGSVADAGQQHIVVGGLSVFERQGYWLSQEIDKVAARFNPADPASIEMHGAPMLNGKDQWRAISRQDRINAIKDCLSIFARSNQSNRVFASIIRKSAVVPRDPVEAAFEQICSRFDQFLWRLHLGGDTQRGVIIFDESSKEKAIQGLAHNFRSIGTTWGVVRNLSEVPLFLDSRASRVLQLADLIAYSVFRKYERNDTQFFDIFKHRFDASGGVVHGLYSYP
jgi:hypothetical protein